MLTPEGEGILRYATEILQQMINAEHFADLRKEKNLRVGMGTITLNYVAPILKTLFGNQSDFKLIIEDLPAFELAKDVSNFKLDLAIVPEFDYGYPELNYIRVSNPQELFCFAAQNHPIFRKNKTTLEWEI